MTIAENLNDLESKLVNVKNTMVNNLTEKGVTSVTTGNTLTEMANSITTIPTGGGGDVNAQWKEIGYDKQPQHITDGIAYAKEILKAKENGQGIEYLLQSSKLTILPNIGQYSYDKKTISKTLEYADEVIDGYSFGSSYIFQDSSITHINKFSSTKGTSCYMAFSDSSIVSINYLSIPKVEDLSSMFYNAKFLKHIPPIPLDNIKKAEGLFYGCKQLQKIMFTGNPSKLINIKDMFGSSTFSVLHKDGTLIYDHRYDYSKIIDELHKWNPTWVTKPDYEIQEVTSLSITADDCVGNGTTTTVHYTAVTNGLNVLNGEHITGFTVTGDAVSNPFEPNPSYETSRQIEVSFTYYGATATTTITQGAKQHPSLTVNLQDQWKQSDNSLVPNPDSLIYDGVYESFSNKGEYDSNAQMKIDFDGMVEVEVYLRNGGVYASEIYVGKLDSETASKTDNQFKVTTYNQKGTDIGSYTKYILKNDGGKHSVIIGYYKGYGSHAEPDCAYILFKKPQE